MRRTWMVMLGITAAAISSLRAAPLFRSGENQVTLVELYTSEGCSSCPPAEKWLGELRSDPGLWRRFVPVAFHVNYWDRLGWHDVFSTPEFTRRQYRYAEAWRANNVYTPCLVKNGTEWRRSDDTAGDIAAPQPKPAGDLTVITQSGGAWLITFVPAPSKRKEAIDLEVTLVLQGGGIVSPVRAGENAGRKLQHEFVALALKTAPLARTADGSFTAVVFLPSPPTGHPEAARHALVAWVAERGHQAPLQATGGWL